jgi:hypothetical protein
LLAELYNAEGEINAALGIMEDCVNGRRFPSEMLRKHHQTIQAEVDRRIEIEEIKDRRKVSAVWVVAIIGGIVFGALMTLQFIMTLLRRLRTR